MNVLLLDASWFQTSYLIAELRDRGVAVVVAAPGTPDPRGLGRYCRQVVSPDVESPDYPRFLRELLQSDTFDLVIPLCEPLQRLVWDMDDLPCTPFPATTPEQRRLLIDRRALYAFASDLGVPIPAFATIQDAEDLDRALEPIGLPCVLRGTQGMSGEQVRIVTDLDAARLAYASLRASSPDPPFAQQFIDGSRCLVGALLDHGRVVQTFAQCTIEAAPPPTGPSIRVRSVHDPVLVDYGRRLLEALGWDGLACAEFIRLGPGDYRFLEINPRPWAAIRAAHSCGVPLLRLFVDYLHGERPASELAYPDGRECTLFPALLTARIRARAFPRVGDARAYWQAVQAAPWSHPSLMRHFLRTVLWSMDAVRRASRTLPAPPPTIRARQP